MSDYGDDFEADEELIAEIAVQRASARALHKEAVHNEAKERKEQERRKEEGMRQRWGARGPTMHPGIYKSEVDKQMEEARTQPGPGHYPAASSINPRRAARFNTGARREQAINDEEGSYLDPLNSTTLTKQGTVISPSHSSRNFEEWDEREVGQWLWRIGLGHLAKSFIHQGVQGKDLLEMTATEARDLLGVQVFSDRRRLLKELSVLRGQLLKAAAFPDLGPGRYNSTTKEIYEITKPRSDRGCAFSKGGPMPILEDLVLREAGEKPAPNTYTHVAERHQHFMSTRLGAAVKFSTGEPMTAVEQRCRQIEDDPAPGTYRPRLPEPRHKGAKMSKSKRKDLWATHSDVPGPGAYSGTGIQLHTISGRIAPRPELGMSTKTIKNKNTMSSDNDSQPDFLTLPPDHSQQGKRKGAKVDRVTCFSAEPATFSWPEIQPPVAHELQQVLEEMYYSDMYADVGSRGQGSRRTPRYDKRGNLISRRAGTAGTGGSFSLKEWHGLLESNGLVPYYLSKLEAIHIFSSARRSNLSVKYKSEGSKIKELRMAVRGLAQHLSVPVINMPLPSLGAKIKDSKRVLSEGQALELLTVAKVDAEVVARYVETQVTINKNRGKAKSYDEKQLQVGEFNEAWLGGIDQRIEKMRVAGDRDNESTAFVLKDLRKKVKATRIRTTF